MTRLWHWIASAIAAAVGVLWVWLQIVSGQRDRARIDAARERERADTGEARRAVERRVIEAQRKAREKATEVARDEDSRRSDGDRSGGLGNDRLHDD